MPRSVSRCEIDAPRGAIGGRVRGGTRPAYKLDRARPETPWNPDQAQHKLGPALVDAAMEPVTEADVPSTLLGGAGAGALSMPELIGSPWSDTL